MTTTQPAKSPWTYLGNPYRDGKWTTNELHLEKEHVHWLLAEVDLENDNARLRESGLAYLLDVLADLEAELARRDRLSKSRYAPKIRPFPTIDRSQLIATIRERLPVAELLRRWGIKLEQKGRTLVCRCPLPGHDDNTPSFHVYPDGGWYCFGCTRGGDVFELARWMLNERSFARVVARLGREVESG
jgi:hypothetical protein